MNQLNKITCLKCFVVCLLSFSLSQIEAFAQVDTSKQRAIDIQEIYNQTLEVNTSLKNGENTEVILLANAIIDSFSQLICHTPYFGYLNYYKGSSYRALGNYYLSEKCYAMAEQCFFEAGDSILLIDSRINLAGTLIVSKKHEEARFILENLFRDFGNSMNHDNRANIYANLASIGIRINDTLLSHRSFEQILGLMEDASGGEFASFITERNYGRYLLSQGRFSEGSKYLHQSLRGAIDSLGQTNFQIGICCNHLGELYSKTEKIDSASFYFNEALDILSPNANEKSSGQPNPQYETVLIECLLNYGDLLIRDVSGNKKAFDLFQKAINRLLYLSHAINAESTRFIIAEKGREAFNKGVIAALNLYKLTEEKYYFDIAFEWSLKAKSLSLNWLTEKDLIYKNAGIPMGLTENLKSLRKSIDLLLKDNLDETLSVSVDSVSQLISLYEKTEEQVRANYSVIVGETEDISMVSLVSESLGRREKYLGFFDVDSVLLAFILTKKGKEIIEIKKDSQLISSMEHFKELLKSSPHANYTETDVEEFSDLSKSLYGRLIKPLIQKHDLTLAIHPDGALLGLSFEALCDEHKNQKTFKELPYLLRSHEIRYVATPFFSEHSRKNFNRKSKLGIITCGISEKASMMESEVKALQSRFPNSTVYYIDELPFELDSVINEQDAIHISSHVSINRQDAFYTGLSCTESDSNFLLTFQDVLFQDIPGYPVFINGCESGSGPINQGEGLMSMGLAFAMAGSKSIIQHLWEASDRSSSEIASNYYRYFTRDNESKALSKARRKYLRNSQIGYDHPYYWAGMVYYGSRDNGAPQSSIIYIILSGAVLLCALFFLRKRINAL